MAITVMLRVMSSINFTATLPNFIKHNAYVVAMLYWMDLHLACCCSARYINIGGHANRYRLMSLPSPGG
eukprot:scaffold318708_cov15-Prasinocladus_malaysianus.AAC.1